MKKILFLIMLVGLFSCQTGDTSTNIHTCELPSEISPEMCGGTPIAWNCDWQMAYNEGNVIINRDSTGCITSIVKVSGEDSGHETLTLDVKGSD